jgi:hypothetical protein
MAKCRLESEAPLGAAYWGLGEAEGGFGSVSAQVPPKCSLAWHRGALALLTGGRVLTA